MLLICIFQKYLKKKIHGFTYILTVNCCMVDTYYQTQSTVSKADSTAES